MKQLYVQIRDKSYDYDHFLLAEDNNGILRSRKKEIRELKCKSKQRGIKCVDSMLLYYVVKELSLSEIYKTSFLNFYINIAEQLYCVKFVLLPTNRDLMDYRWNDRVSYMIRERCELDHALSWLSTLGGAFSALGDYFEACAKMAGKISVHQLQLALRLNDPNIVTRCRLYFSLSLIQRKYFKLAKTIVREEYVKAKSSTVVDHKLVNMCRGIWSKLQYEHELYRKNKRHS